MRFARRTTYWFANAYVLLFILSPFINKLIRSMDRKMHFRLICILSIIWCIIPSLPVYAVFASNLGWSNFDWTNLGWFILIYLIASYIRLYPMNYTSKCKLNFYMAGFFYGMLILLTALFYSLGGKFQKQAPNIMGMNNLLLLLCSVTLFLAFKNLKIKPSKWINAVAAAMFGVYLIHDNRLVRPFLWKTVFKNASYAESPSLFLHALIAVVSVLIVCIFIDFIISWLIEKPLCTLAGKVLNSASPYMKKLSCFAKKCFDRTLNRREKTGRTNDTPDNS